MLPRRGEIRPAQLVQGSHRRRGAGVQRQDVWAEFGKNAVGAVSSVTSAEIVATPSRARTDFERLAPRATTVTLARRHERLDQSQAEATASAGDDGNLIFDAHRVLLLCLGAAKTIELGKRVNHVAGSGRQQRAVRLASG